MKVLVVSGGVISGLGKGITTASLARLLKARGISVTVLKIDPYLNVDAGTMNPYQHGEVFVLDDGTEVDLDLGNYERFLGQSLTGSHNITTGKVYRAVIDKERRGDYLGTTVQIIPHITGEIKRQIREVAQTTGADVVLVEVGGTVGDIESMPFLEALRELSYELGEGHMAFVHTTLVPVAGPVGEPKTKPTQHSVRELRAIGIRPSIIVARASVPLTPEIKAKISLFCDVPPEAVISVPDQQVIYEVPLVLEAQGVGQLLSKQLKLPDRPRTTADGKNSSRPTALTKGASTSPSSASTRSSRTRTSPTSKLSITSRGTSGTRSSSTGTIPRTCRATPRRSHVCAGRTRFSWHPGSVPGASTARSEPSRPLGRSGSRSSACALDSNSRSSSSPVTFWAFPMPIRPK